MASKNRHDKKPSLWKQERNVGEGSIIGFAINIDWL